MSLRTLAAFVVGIRRTTLARMALFVCASAVLGACVPSTGGQRVSFRAVASGPDDAVKGQPLSFTTPRGYAVTLTSAVVFVGALYLNQTNPAGYSAETSCISPGMYTGEVRGSVLVDALSPVHQTFSAQGEGTDTPSLSGELFLTGGDVDAAEDRTVVFEAAGVASRGAKSWPFDVRYTIGSNRAIPPRNAALPGSNPLCKQRIVTPIPLDVRLANGGTLHLVVDPRAFFASVEFSELQLAEGSTSRFAFVDGNTSAGQPDIALFNGLKSAVGPYHFRWYAAE